MAAEHVTTSNGQATDDRRLIGRLLGHMKAQRAKSVVTVVLVVVLVVLVLRGVSRPRAASAAGPELVPTQSAAALLPEVSLESVQSLLRMPTPNLQAIQAVRTGPLVLPRDLFAADLKKYPWATGKERAEAPTTEPVVPPAKRLEAQVEELKRQAAALRLDGTVTGPASVAFLDGRSVHEGEEYAGFRVVEIRNQGLIVERDGIRLELRMAER